MSAKFIGLCSALSSDRRGDARRRSRADPTTGRSRISRSPRLQAVPEGTRLRDAELHLRAGRDGDRPGLAVHQAAGDPVRRRPRTDRDALPEPQPERPTRSRPRGSTRATRARCGRRGARFARCRFVAPGAIEWLLLDVSGEEFGPTAGDKLARAAFIQRVNTIGGIKPPSAECTAATLNTRKLVPYEADYYFYRSCHRKVLISIMHRTINVGSRA